MANAEETTLVNFEISEKLILVKDNAKTPEEIIRKLGGLLYDNGFVKDSYTQAVLEREVIYPTGLQARMGGVAIPHTDTEHVLKSAIAMATLAKPITFHMMATPDDVVDVEIIIMLAVHDAKLVIPVLRKVIFILENDEALRVMKNATTKSEIKNAMLKHIQTMNEKMK